MKIYKHTRKDLNAQNAAIKFVIFKTAENETEAKNKKVFDSGFITTEYHSDSNCDAEFRISMDSENFNALDETTFDFADCDPQSDDFGAGNFRFIKASAIDTIMLEELGYDAYVLGCFNASFIASCFDMPQKLIEICQKAEAYQELGEIMLKNAEGMKKLQKDYVSADGYGHHFAGYDFETHECTINGEDWLFFRTN